MDVNDRPLTLYERFLIIFFAVLWLSTTIGSCIVDHYCGNTPNERTDMRKPVLTPRMEAELALTEVRGLYDKACEQLEDAQDKKQAALEMYLKGEALLADASAACDKSTVLKHQLHAKLLAAEAEFGKLETEHLGSLIAKALPPESET